MGNSPYGFIPYPNQGTVDAAEDIITGRVRIPGMTWNGDPTQLFGVAIEDGRLDPYEFVNEPVHPKWASHRVKIKHGVIIRRSAEYKGIRVPEMRLNFMMNPHTVDLGYAILEDELPRDLTADAGFDSAPRLFSKNASVSFELLFDRIYEMLDDPLHHPGTTRDLVVLERMMGMESNQRLTVGAGQQAAAIMAPVDVFFGGEQGIQFSGYVKGASATITHFTPEMRPMRMKVSLTVERRQGEDPSRNSDRSGPTSLEKRVFGPVGRDSTSNDPLFYDRPIRKGPVITEEVG